MKRFIIASIAAALVSTMAVKAQQVTIVTLDDCRRMAVENNASVKIAAGNAAAASEVKKEAFTKYFPTVDADGLGLWTNRPIINYDIFNMFNLRMIRQGLGASIAAVQPVFAGGRIVNGNKLASVGAEAASLQHQDAVDDARLKAEGYYWQLFTLKAKRRTLASVIEMVDTLANQVGVAVKAGVVTRNDLLKVELKRNELRSMMVDLDNGITLSGNLLAQYIGLDGQAIDIADAELPETVPPYPSDIFVDPSVALPSTTDYRLLNQQVKAAELEQKMAMGANMPTVGVGAGLFYDRIVHQDNTFGAVFVNVNIPISDWWGGSHAVNKKRIEAQNARLQRDDLSQMIEIAMQNAWDDLTAAYRKMEIAKESIGQSTENLRINRNFYDAGVSTITDLLDAQTLYRQSLDQYAESYGNFCLKRATYLNATGRSE